MDKRTLLILLLTTSTFLAAQKRYFDPIFQHVKVTEDIVYGSNFAIPLLTPPGFHPFRQSLLMDVYEPDGDSLSDRPLVVLLHGGYFLPPPNNGNCNGTKRDGEIVELAQRLARRGYLVAAMDYRIGWNPVASTELARRFTFVNAVHRGVQDARTCVRFFRKDHLEENQFRIDPEKIILWGTETGSFIALASATLDDMSDWDSEQFQISPGFPMLQDTFNGNLDGTSVGTVSQVYNQITGYSVGDTLCSPNHVGYTSDVALVVNMSEGLLDSSWLQTNEIPIISFATPSVTLGGPVVINTCDMYCLGCWQFPFPAVVLAEVAGSCVVQSRQNELGNNAVWHNASFNDPISTYSLAINEGREGFYPFWGATEPAPWAFSTMQTLPPSMVCDTNAIDAKAYLDTIIAYFVPRACVVLNLDIQCNSVLMAQKSAPNRTLLEVIPNPARNETWIRASEPMVSYEIYTLQGNLVQSRTGISEINILIQKGNFPAGLYLIKAYLSQDLILAKLIWE